MAFSPMHFVLGILAIVVGIPVICDTIIKLVHGPKESKKERKERLKRESLGIEENQEILEEIFYGLKDLGKRVSNLETILDEKDRGDKYE